MRASSLQNISAPMRLAARRSAAAPLALSQVRRASHGPHYNQPSGYLFGEKPGHRQKEDWENIYMYGMFGGMALFGVLYLYKPDTTVQTWALAEAKKKIEQEGSMPKWEKS